MSCGFTYHLWSVSALKVHVALVAVVAVLVGAHPRKPEWHVLDAAIFLVSLAVVWAGVAVAF